MQYFGLKQISLGLGLAGAAVGGAILIFLGGKNGSVPCGHTLW